MFTDLLFDHKYDIDALLRAFCGDDHQGRWLLDSRQGLVIAEPEEAGDTADVQDGDDEGHWHVIEPLPRSVLEEVTQHKTFTDLPEEEQHDVNHMLQTCPKMYDLYQRFDENVAGGWLRARVKDIVMDWLDDRGMIPPSMRHVRPEQLFGPPPAPKQVKISFD